MPRFVISFAFGGAVLAQSLMPWGEAAHCSAQQLAPSAAVATSSAIEQTGPTLRQRQYLGASDQQRVRIAEEIGEEGARAFAKSKGWTAISDGTKKGIAQGVDQVYRDPDGFVHAVEAKGGTSQPKRFHGHMQGSPEHAVEASKNVLKNPNASATQKAGAKAVIEAAAKGTLRTHVIQTSHVLGEPAAAVLKQTAKTTPAAQALAKAALKGGKSAAAVGGRAASKVIKVAGPVGAVVDAGFRVNDGMEIEKQFQEGLISEQEREVEHAANAAGMVGGWGGALAGAKLGGIGGGAAGSCVAPGPGTVIGGTAGAVAGGVAGYIGGEAAAEAAAEWSVNKVHAAGSSVQGAANQAAEVASDAGNGVSSFAKRSWTWATDW